MYLESKVDVNCAELEITLSPSVFRYRVSNVDVNCAEPDTIPAGILLKLFQFS